MYGRAGHQEAFVEFVPAKFHRDETNLYRYSLSYEAFKLLFRKLEGEEFDDEMAMILLANA
jgi:hypothetical protein